MKTASAGSANRQPLSLQAPSARPADSTRRRRRLTTGMDRSVDGDSPQVESAASVDAKAHEARANLGELRAPAAELGAAIGDLRPGPLVVVAHLDSQRQRPLAAAIDAITDVDPVNAHVRA